QGGFTYTRNTDLMLATELRSKNPETTQLALMAFVMVDRVTKRSDRIDNNLDLLEKLSDRELSFPVLSFQFERLLHKKDLDWHEFAKLHERAWSRFSLKTSVSEDPVLAALQRRWTGEAAEFWLTELEYRS